MSQMTVKICFAVVMAMSGSAFAQTASTYIEELTWMEIRDAIAAGKTTALYYAGSTEQNGPHMATGKHNWIARHVAGRIAAELGNALVYPGLPFAPTGDIQRKTQHMAYAGSVSVSEDTFARVAREVAQSAAAAGFKCVVLMGDHGGGQRALNLVAKTLSAQWQGRGVRVIYGRDVYERANQRAMSLLKERGLPYGDHASIIDTSELMFVEPSAVRQVQLTAANPQTGSAGFAQSASAELGQQFIEFKVQAAVAQINSSAGCAKR